MAKIILNIGLSSPSGGTVSHKALFEALGEFKVVYFRVDVSKNSQHPEKTACVHIETSMHFEHEVFQLANNLEQDCIAAYDTLAGVGSLIGPDAESWGDFRLEFFQFV